MTIVVVTSGIYPRLGQGTIIAHTLFLVLVHKHLPLVSYVFALKLVIFRNVLCLVLCNLQFCTISIFIAGTNLVRHVKVLYKKLKTKQFKNT